jgi:hypothetical protein
MAHYELHACKHSCQLFVKPNANAFLELYPTIRFVGVTREVNLLFHLRVSNFSRKSCTDEIVNANKHEKPIKIQHIMSSPEKSG